MTARPRTDREKVEKGRYRLLWFGLVAGPAAWALHVSIVAAFSGWACADGTLALGPVSEGGVRLILAGLTVLAIGIGIAGMIVAWRNWKWARNGSQGTEATSANTAGFMAVSGLLVGSLSLLGMIYAVVPQVFVEECGKLQ